MAKKKAKKYQAATGKVSKAKRTIGRRVDQINRVINRLESEVEGLLKRLVKQGERSRKELRKNFEDLLSKIRGSDLIAFAHETREDLEREVRRRAEDIVEVVKEIEKISNRLDLGGVLQDVRRSFGDLVAFLNESGLIQTAKQTVLKTRKEVLSFLSIPTHDEVVKLEKKIVNLEKRLSHLTRRAA
jgi:polyhydroxyalkanoate synthesis regulator phasin